MRLSSPITDLKGVGPKTADQLRGAGLKSVFDVMTYLPRGYEDYTAFTTIEDMQPGKVTIKAHCEKISTRPVRRGLKITTAVLADDTGKVNAVWFNQPYRVKQLSSGDEFYFAGNYDLQYKRYQLSSPSVESIKDVPVTGGRIVPVYRAVNGLKTVLLRKIIDNLRPIMNLVDESLPARVVEENHLMSLSDTLINLHFPDNQLKLVQARQRWAFEELFTVILASRLNKQANTKLIGWHIPFELETVKKFVANLPFELTGAQRRAAWDILQDFEKKTPMNRLVQGDVGAGKTVVAGLAARQAASHGFQTAFMAPTEILASQHAETLQKMLSPFGVNVALLVGSVKGKARKNLLEALANGQIDVLVGTHALFQDKVIFKRLGFVVIDEQHRFGVEQRNKLLAKSQHLPHLLAMTATPIPRSLALTVYGELDISIVNERPKNRLPIETKIISPNSVSSVHEHFIKEIKAGRQGYVICSLIEDNPDNEVKSVKTVYDHLRQGPFKNQRLAILHGKMKAEEKEQVMQDFKDHKFDILVSTTVVEVGVDVPNATIMMIENADQFGLSQLHQLRGRVGRSNLQSYCYLIMSDSSKPSQRLREIERSNDGFYLAEVDLKLRGPGEIYGKAQHGALNMQIASLSDTKLIAAAQKAVESFINNQEDLLKYKMLAAQVQHYQKLTTLN